MGLQGLIAKVVQKQVSVHSILSSNDFYTEEREAMSARIQLECRCYGKGEKCYFKRTGKTSKGRRKGNFLLRSQITILLITCDLVILLLKNGSKNYFFFIFPTF